MKVLRFTCFLLAACVAMAVPRSPVRAASLIEPPFVRKWTALTGDGSAVIAVRDGLVFCRSQDGIGALNLATGSKEWWVLRRRWMSAAALHGQTIYAFSQAENRNELIAIDLATHKSRSITIFGSTSGEIAVDAKHLYFLGDDSVLRAYDHESFAEVWNRRLGKSGTRDQILVAAGALYVADDDRQYGVDPIDGTILWQRSAQYASLYPSFVYGSDIVTQFSGLRRTNVHTGKIIWNGGDTDGNARLVSNVVISNNGKDFVGRSLDNGRVLWKHPLPDAVDFPSITSEDEKSISDGVAVWMARDPLIAMIRDGREKWRLAEPFDGSPSYVDSSRIVTQDNERILCYAQGSLAPLPTAAAGKAALARQMAQQFEFLDAVERKRLVKLTPFSFEPLLARYLEWANQVEKETVEDPNSQLHYTLVTDALPLLTSIARREDTAAIVKALPTLQKGSEWREHLEEILQKKGAPAGFIPLLVANLRRTPFKDRGYCQALDAVARSSHPQAVALMVEALNDPHAAPAWRCEAFRHLAGTGGAAGVAAVRKQRRGRTPRRAWFQQVDLSKLRKDEILGLKTDSRKRTWMLFKSGLLGNSSDLFIVQKLPAGWGRPLFTGAWTERTFNREAPTTFRGIPTAKLAATEWIRIFPDDPSICRDSDGDGLTDVVEARLGTNPHKADTDGDKLSDAIDPCPNAAPRALGDTEKITAACVEARFFEADWHTPAVLSVDKVKPFELYGYSSPVMWSRSRWENSLTKMYGGGVNVIGFHNPDIDSGGSNNRPAIEFSLDHKTATTAIRRYSGGLNGDGTEVVLKKFGNDWLAVDMIPLYVS